MLVFLGRAVSLSLVASAWKCPYKGIELSRSEVQRACEKRCDNGLDFTSINYARILETERSIKESAESERSFGEERAVYFLLDPQF